MITPGAERRGIPVARAREGNLRPSRGSGVPVLSEARKLPSDETERVGKTEPSIFRSLRSVYISPTARSLTAGAKLNFFQMPPLAPRGDGGPARPAWRRGPRSRTAGQDDAIQPSGG